MSKTPAKKATPKKAAAGKAAARQASRPPRRPSPVQAAAKPMSKAAPKLAPAKAPVKPVAKTAAKPAAKPTAKPASETLREDSPPNRPPSQPASPPAKACRPSRSGQAPVVKAAESAQAKPALAAPAPPPAAAAKPRTAPATSESSRAALAPRLGAPVPAPLPPATSRFADRFAPPRPPTRQMNNLGLDTPKPTQKADPKLANAWKTKAGRDLTEAEMLAMPDSEYMNDKQLEFFRLKLQTLKDDLLTNAGETTEHLREDTSIVPDPADRATIEEEHALELRTRDRERKLLKKISQSLARIEAGDYGFCDETGEPIGLGRLIARPTATLSLEAQQRRELKQKMFGD